MDAAFTCNVKDLTQACKAIAIGHTDIINGFIVRRLHVDLWTVVSAETLENLWAMPIGKIVSYILSGEIGE